MVAPPRSRLLLAAAAAALLCPPSAVVSYPQPPAPGDLLTDDVNPAVPAPPTPEEVMQTVVGERSSYGAPSKTTVDTNSHVCSDYLEDGFECVAFDQCADGEIIVDGGGLFDIRSGLADVTLDPENSKCPSSLEICCRHPDFFGEPIVGPPTTTQSTTTTTQWRDPLTYARCGRRNSDGVRVRIQGPKSDTQFGEWPHMCAVLQKKQIAGQEINLFVCGASLVAPGLVLTAAHCVKDHSVSDLRVRCGEWDTQQEIEPLPHQDRDVSSLWLHPEFNPDNLADDLALMSTVGHFDIADNVVPACLPDAAEFAAYDKADCVATGWGKDEWGADGQYQVIMKQVTLDMVDRQTCQNELRTTKLGRFFRLHPSFVCAGGQTGADTCKGDGGGPLVCPVRDSTGSITNYVQAGIVAWGVGCGGDVPAVYAGLEGDSMCFLELAGRCLVDDGKDDFEWGGYSGSGLTDKCQGWAQRRYEHVQGQITSLLARIEKRSSQSLVDRLERARQVEEQLSILGNLCEDTWTAAPLIREESSEEEPYQESSEEEPYQESEEESSSEEEGGYGENDGVESIIEEIFGGDNSNEGYGGGDGSEQSVSQKEDGDDGYVEGEGGELQEKGDEEEEGYGEEEEEEGQGGGGGGGRGKNNRRRNRNKNKNKRRNNRRRNRNKNKNNRNGDDEEGDAPYSDDAEPAQPQGQLLDTVGDGDGYVEGKEEEAPYVEDEAEGREDNDDDSGYDIDVSSLARVKPPKREDDGDQ